MEKIFPSWDFGTHLLSIEVVGELRLPLQHQTLLCQTLPLSAPQSGHEQSKVHVPASSGKGGDEVLLYPTQAAHDGDDAVMDLQVVAQEWHHYEP